MAEEAKWYVIHTYSGYENKVAANLKKIVENRGLEAIIQDVKIPCERVLEGGEAGKEADRRLFPSYVLVKMILTDETWHVVRNIRGVTSFVGPGSKPIPLTDEEISKFDIDPVVIELAYVVGDSVIFKGGIFSGSVGVVEEISPDKKKAKVTISMFGRPTTIEADTSDIRDIS